MAEGVWVAQAVLRGLEAVERRLEQLELHRVAAESSLSGTSAAAARERQQAALAQQAQLARLDAMERKLDTRAGTLADLDSKLAQLEESNRKLVLLDTMEGSLYHLQQVGALRPPRPCPLPCWPIL